MIDVPVDGPESRRKLALDTVLGRPTRGIPAFWIHCMEWSMIDRLAGLPEGSYEANPVPAYRKMLENAGCCAVDQWIPRNPLTMGRDGYDGAKKARTATTGLKELVLDGMRIDSPEAVVEHLERFAFPALEAETARFDEDAAVRRMLEGEERMRAEAGPWMLKLPYMELAAFPKLAYGVYGYENYFMAYALYPEVMARSFRLLVDLGPRTGLFLSCSSSIAPGVPWENLKALAEGFRHYREHGRDAG